MRRTLIVTVLFGIFFIGLPPAQSETTTSIAQEGITFTFSEAKQYGQFANGDYWVLGPVTITSITPAFDGSNNGWEVNPELAVSPGGSHGFQSGCYGLEIFDADLVPSLPYTSPSSGTVSVVKTISNLPTTRPCIKTAVVLTIVTAIPANSGATVFRPPYISDEKPFYNVSDLRTDLLPTYAPVGAPTSLSYIESRFAKLRLDHGTAQTNRSLRPADSMADYQPKNTQDITDAALRLMLNDSVEDKLPALIQYVQAGIDKLYTIKNGQTWPAGGGHQPAHALPAAFTAIMLDLTSFANTYLVPATWTHASETMLYSTSEGEHLWGANDPETNYWNYVRGLGGNRSIKDPYGYIDGGQCGTDYQLVTSQAHKGEILAGTLMPVLQNAWNTDAFAYAKNYVERWVEHGTWASPDPCAPVGGTYGVDYGPDGSGFCILDPNLAYYNSPTDFACASGQTCGRFPEKHGESKDGGQYRSAFVAAMWDAHWDETHEKSAPVLPIEAPAGLKIIQ